MCTKTERRLQWIALAVAVQVFLVGCADSNELRHSGRAAQQRPNGDRPGGSQAVVAVEVQAQKDIPARHSATGPATYLGRTEGVRLAVLDFEVQGGSPLSARGPALASRLASHFFPPAFALVERARLEKVLEEHDLQAARVVSAEGRQALGRLADVSYVVLGSVTVGQPLSVDARMIDVETGEVRRQAGAAAPAADEVDEAVDSVALVLSASDADYERLLARHRDRDAALKRELARTYPIVERKDDHLSIAVRASAAGGDEVRLYQRVRQELRETYARHCFSSEGARRTQAWLMDYCRQHEECEDIRTIGAFKIFQFNVPLPP